MSCRKSVRHFGAALGIHDGFLGAASSEALRGHALGCVYHDIVHAGKVYSGVSDTTGTEIEAALSLAIAGVRAAAVTPITSFFRLAGEDISTGQGSAFRVHTDQGIAAWTCVYYLAPPGLERGGTAFWSPLGGGPVSEDGYTDPRLWRRDMVVSMAFDRAVIFRAAWAHSADPLRGWGRSPEEARLAWCCFFDHPHHPHHPHEAPIPEQPEQQVWGGPKG